ncbi:distal tail protein Dit [Listeria innocua]
MAIGFTYKDIHSSFFDVEIIDYKNQFFPENSGSTESPSGRIGAFYFGPNIGERTIEIQIQILADSLDDLSEKASEVADWLMQTDNIERSLTIDEDRDKVYFGRFEGTTDIERRLYNGLVTLNFVCSDPHAYYEQQDMKLKQGSTELHVQGSQPTRPIINAVLKEDITSLSIATRDKYVYLGDGVDPDTGETPVKPSEIIINDPMNDLTRWTPVTKEELTFQLDYKNGEIDGTYTSNENAIYPSDFGVGDNWHGPMSKIVLSQSLDNWKVRIRVQNMASAQSQQGKLEIYLVDPNGDRIGLLQVKDNDPNSEVNYIKLEIGTQYSTSYPQKILYNETGKITKTYKTVQKKVKVNGKYKTINEKVQTGSYSEFRDFYGYLELTKLGNTFSVEVVKYDKNIKPITIKKLSFIDTENKYIKKLAQLNIYAAAWGTRDPNYALKFADTRVEKLNSVLADKSQIIAQKGEEIMVDCETETIYKDGVPFMQNLAIGSKWIDLLGGESMLLNVAPFSAAEWYLSYRPKSF